MLTTEQEAVLDKFLEDLSKCKGEEWNWSIDADDCLRAEFPLTVKGTNTCAGSVKCCPLTGTALANKGKYYDTNDEYTDAGKAIGIVDNDLHKLIVDAADLSNRPYTSDEAKNFRKRMLETLGLEKLNAT